MPFYVVKAIDTAGREVKRTVEADNEVQLLSFLEFLNLTPLKISKRPEFIGKVAKFLHLRKIKRKDLIDLFENLHLLAQSGVPLSVGIWELADDMDNPAIKDMLYDVSYGIQSGLSLSSAMKKYERILGSIAISLISIGEETGGLDRVFKDISEHYRRIEDFISKTKQALIYPAFVLISITTALIFWLVYVLPKIAQLFSDLNVELPTITVIVIKVSKFVQNYILFIMGALIIFILLFLFLRRKNERFRYVTDKLFLRIPIISTILYTFNYAFFSEYMRLMISAGISLYDTLQTLEDTFNNRVFKRAMEFIKEHISAGGSISEGMRKTGIFPSLMIRMITVGEETGGLDDQLDYLARYYYNKLDYITQNIAKIIEPIIIITVGLFMATIMISLLLPIYDLIGRIGKQF